jgi:hypothetical protein
VHDAEHAHAAPGKDDIGGAERAEEGRVYLQERERERDR